MLQLERGEKVTVLRTDSFHILLDKADGLMATLVACDLPEPFIAGVSPSARGDRPVAPTMSSDTSFLCIPGDLGPTVSPAGPSAEGCLRVVTPDLRPAIADLFLLSACNADGRPDYSYDASPPVIHQENDAAVVEIVSASSIWQRKKYFLRCTSDRIEYYYLVQGSGHVDDCEFFQGFVGRAPVVGPDRPWIEAGYEGGLHGRVRSKARFPGFFNPEPNGLRKQHFSPTESSTIGVRSDKSYCRGNWFFTPAPFCYAVQTRAGKWLAIGLMARPGENGFTEYEFNGGNGFGLSLRYEGKLCVDRAWESPHVVLFRADDEYSAIGRYCDHLREAGYVFAGGKPAYDWWREPIFCGWGEQVYLSYAEGSVRNAQSYATQDDYERFVARLEHIGLTPGTVVVDDKWQKDYGEPLPDLEKWPDLAGFIARQRAAGRRVLLWLKAWDPEGVPPEECLVDRYGSAVGVDPASAGYEKRLRRCIRTLVGEFGADGFKIDFTASMPLARMRADAPGLWGVELLRRLLWIIYDEAKQTKPDALIIAHTANPYFADVVDMLRLNDVAILSADDRYAESMIHRQKVARAASPAWLIDTDNWPSPTLASWLEYIRLQPELGVPSLYYVTHIDESGEEIAETHAREIAQLWADYRSKVRSGSDGAVVVEGAD
ncbi:MAG: hypothetical protein HYY30_15030 [Chloroflexi bacterium]|nr:hypothetical protein [Chloroflexota bacterium]